MGSTSKTIASLVFLAGLLFLAVPHSAMAVNLPWTFFMWFPNITATTTSVQPLAGDTIRLDGDGHFDDVAGTIVGGGSFTHFDENGNTVERGTWRATVFISFQRLSEPVPLGTREPAFVGGILSFRASFQPSLAGSSDELVTLYCAFRAEGQVPFEGTAVGPFDLPIQGRTGIVSGLGP